MVHNPRGDGNCGFRALAIELFGVEETYKKVKVAMRDYYFNNCANDYAEYPHERLENILHPERNEWFLFPECAQIAADTFKTPVAFYYEHESQQRSYIFFPLQVIPTHAERTNPIVLQHTNAHIFLVKIKSDHPLQWPEIYPQRPLGRHEIRSDPWYSLFKDSFENSIRPHPGYKLPEEREVDAIILSDTDSESEIFDLTK